VPYKDHVGGGGFMRRQPLAEVITGHIDGLVGLVTGIYLGVNDMCLNQQVLQKAVYMSGEGAERSVVPHEAVDVDDEEPPFSVVLVAIVGRWYQGMSGRRPGVAVTPLRSGEAILVVFLGQAQTAKRR
jgi:hypothetical protein